MALDAHAIAVLVLTAFAFVLFAREDLAIETSSLLIVTLLAAGFILFPYSTAAGPLEPADFFLGFGNSCAPAHLRHSAASSRASGRRARCSHLR